MQFGLCKKICNNLWYLSHLFTYELFSRSALAIFCLNLLVRRQLSILKVEWENLIGRNYVWTQMHVFMISEWLQLTAKKEKVHTVGIDHILCWCSCSSGCQFARRVQLNVTRYVVIVWFAENNEKLFNLHQMNVSVWYAVVKITTFRITLNLKKKWRKKEF